MTDTKDVFNESATLSSLADFSEFHAEIQDPQNAGLVAFHRLNDFQEHMVQHNFALWDDMAYKAAGFESRDAFLALAQEHAYIAAHSHFKSARLKEPFTATTNNLERHPCNDYQNGFSFLKKSGRKLFADATFKPLGFEGTEDFYAVMQWAHTDAARQTYRIAGEMLDTHNSSDAAIEWLQNAKKHMDRLGIADIDDRLADLLQIDETRHDDLNRAAHQKHFQAIALEASQAYQKGQLPQYFEFLADAKGVLNEVEGLGEDDATFEGTNFLRGRFFAEYERAVPKLIRMYVERLQADNKKHTDKRDIFVMLAALRGLAEEEIDVPENVSAMHAMEDYWQFEVFNELGFRNYEHFMDHNRRIYAAELAVPVLRRTEHMAPHEVHEALLEVEDLLKTARVPLDRDRIFFHIGLDRTALLSTLRATSAEATKRAWSLSFFINQENQDQREKIADAEELMDRIAGTAHFKELDGALDGMSTRLNDLTSRAAEEAFADAAICMDENGADEPLNAAFGLLMESGHSLDDDAFLARMGMGRTQANHFKAWHVAISILDDWNDVSDSDEDVSTRFKALQSFDAKLAQLDAFNRSELLSHITHSEESMAQFARELVEEVLEQALHAANNLEKSPIAGAQQMEQARAAVTYLNPLAFDNEFVFRRLTKTPLAAFLEMEETFSKKADKETAIRNPQPVKIETCDVDETIAQLVEIYAMKPGEEAYKKIARLAGALARTGTTINNPVVLEAAEMTAEELENFIDTCALTAAGEEVHKAMCHGDAHEHPRNMSRHSYNNWHTALEWMGRSSYSIMRDEPYQSIGLAGRSDFMDRMRESLMQFVMGLEVVIAQEGAAVGSAHLFAQTINEIRNGYIVLGHDKALYAQDASRILSALTHRDRVDTQKAIRRMAVSMTHSIKASNETFGGKYRKMEMVGAIFNGFMAEDGKLQQDADTIRGSLQDILHGRISHVMDKFMLRTDKVGRAVNIAFGVNKLRIRHELDDKPWFREVFESHGFDGFAGFVEYVVTERIDQLHKRIASAMGNTGILGGQLESAAFNREILRDVGRIENLMQSELVDDERVIEIMNRVNITQDAIEGYKRQSGPKALPLLMAEAQDPTLPIEERYGVMADCTELYNFLGTEALSSGDWNAFGQARTDVTLRIVGKALFADFLRGFPNSLSPALLNAHGTLSLIDHTFRDFAAMRHIGLSVDEAKAMKTLDRMIIPYAHLNFLAFERDGASSQVVFAAILETYAHAKKYKIDLTGNETAKILGLRESDDFQKIIDGSAFELVKGLVQVLPTLDHDPKLKRLQAEAILSIMDLTGVEERRPGMLEKMDSSRAGLKEILRPLPKAASGAMPAQRTGPRLVLV